MKKVKKSTLIPSLLLLYLAVMSVIGYRSMREGAITPLFYALVIAGTLLCIAGVHFSMKHREKIHEKNNQKYNKE